MKIVQYISKKILKKKKELENKYGSKEAMSKAKSWAKGKAALHGPDKIAGGKANNFSRLGDSKINSSIGAQWKARARIGKLDNYINMKSETLSGSTKLSELDIEFVLK